MDIQTEGVRVWNNNTQERGLVIHKRCERCVWRFPIEPFCVLDECQIKTERPPKPKQMELEL